MPAFVCGRVVARVLGFGVFLVVLVIAVLFFLVPTLLGAPWVPTRIENVRKMLTMARVTPGDVVYDLGCGDGRIIFMAAKEFHARSVGIEVNPLWVMWTHGRIRLSRVQDQVRVVWGTFFGTDLRAADVVTLYLLQGTNERLQHKLETELKQGARVVSHYFTFPGWRPVDADYQAHLYLYEIGLHRYSM